MTEEEFEEIFGDVPFENIQKIKIYISNNYISKDKIKNIIKELEEQQTKEIEETGMSLLSVPIRILKSLLEGE